MNGEPPGGNPLHRLWAVLEDQVRGQLKEAARRVPPLRRIMEDLQRLRSPVAQLELERAALGSQGAVLSRQCKDLREEVEQLKRGEHGDTKQFVPPGHFYSPIPPLTWVRDNDARIFGASGRELPGIDLQETRQMELVEKFQGYYDELSFPVSKSPGHRYFFENHSYSYSDGFFLHSMIRHVRPKRIIEVGSGYSSSMMLDTNERFFDGAIDLTFVEPYPDLLKSLMRPDDEGRVKIIAQGVQGVDPALFQALQAGDILFIDSTHVSRVGSDVNYLFFEVLPRLAPGVYVHIHDIFYPFEYPREWIYEGRSWNEAYLLRCLLSHTSAWEIVLFNTFVEQFHRKHFEQHLPLCLKNAGGSIWLRRRELL